MKKEKNHKAIIETMINTTAIALTSMGTLLLTQADGDFWKGLALIFIGMSLEFIKYWGRKIKLW